MTPLISGISSFSEVHLGMPTVLACLVTGYPLPTISWKKDGEELNSSINNRVDNIRFSAENNKFQDIEYRQNVSIADLLMMFTTFTIDQVLQLGELGVVGLLSFEETVRGDTANYTCSTINSLPKTTTLMAVSENISLTILGEPNTAYAFLFIFTLL